jgi:small subunit ribosomal protein S18
MADEIVNEAEEQDFAAEPAVEPASDDVAASLAAGDEEDKASEDKREAIASRSRARRRRKVSFLSQNKISVVDYKDVALLKRFINDEGKILSRRQTGCTAKEQRMVARAIRRAREMALLPFVALDSSGGGRSSRSRSPYDAPFHSGE